MSEPNPSCGQCLAIRRNDPDNRDPHCDRGTREVSPGVWEGACQNCLQNRTTCTYNSPNRSRPRHTLPPKRRAKNYANPFGREHSMQVTGFSAAQVIGPYSGQHGGPGSQTHYTNTWAAVDGNNGRGYGNSSQPYANTGYGATSAQMQPGPGYAPGQQQIIYCGFDGCTQAGIYSCQIGGRFRLACEWHYQQLAASTRR